MGKETEVISKGKKRILMNFHFALGKEIWQDSSVLPQQPMNISDKIIWVTVKPVIVVIPALIRTEFFIGTAS